MQNVTEKNIVEVHDVPEWCDEIVACYIDDFGHRVGETMPVTIVEKNGCRIGALEVEPCNKMRIRYGFNIAGSDINWL